MRKWKSILIWKIDFDSDVEKDFKKLDHTAQKRIIKFLKEKIAINENPRIHGKPLTGKLSGLWRYRVGDYRIISRIEDHIFTVLVIKVGHRKAVYDT